MGSYGRRRERTGQEQLASPGAMAVEEDEPTDVLPLSAVFPRWFQERNPPGPRAPRVPTKGRPPGRARRKKPRGNTGGGADPRVSDGAAAREGEEGRCCCCCSSSGRHLRSCKAGGIVWSKASRQAWWRPGVIGGGKGSAVMVSFFPSGRARWFHESRILGFEENYLRLAEADGAAGEDEVGFALAELGRRTALALRCGCRCQVVGGGGIPMAQIVEARQGFDPVEVVRFVKIVAVRAWIDDEGSAGAARAAAQVVAYRRHASFCQTGAAGDGRVSPADLLDFVLCVAVSTFPGSEEAVGGDRAAVLVHLYRRFVSMNPGWMYQRPTEEIDSSTTESSNSYEGSCLETSSDFSSEVYENEVDEQGEDHGTFQEQEPGEWDFCIADITDYSIHSSNKYSVMLDDQMEENDDANATVGIAVIEEKLELAKRASSDTSPLNSSSTHTFGHKLRNQLPLSDLKKFPYTRKGTARSYQDDEINATIKMAREVEFPSRVNSDEPGDSPSAVVSRSKTVGGSTFRDENCHDKEHTQTIVSDFIISSKRTADLSSAHGSSICCLGLKTEANSHLSVGLPIKPQQNPVARTWHNKKADALCVLLWQLRCLALDPFFVGSGTLTRVHQTLIKVRVLLFQKTSQPFYTICSSVDALRTKSEVGFNKVLRIHSDTVKAQQGGNIGGNLTSEVSHKTHVAKNGANFQSRTGHVTVKRRKTIDGSHVEHISCSAVSVDGVCVKKRSFDRTLVSNKSSDHITQTVGAEAELLSPWMLDNLNSINKQTDVPCEFHAARGISGKAVFPGGFGYNVDNLQSSGNVSFATNVINEGNVNVAFRCNTVLPLPQFGESFHRNPDQPTLSDISKLWRMGDSSGVIGRVGQPLMTDRGTSFSRSLHMKFPKDFELPSKEGLEKMFRVFGPLDHSRTRVFFYTGSGQVVFLNPAHATIAYNYVRKKQVFGQANVRFWLDSHENSRKEDRSRTSSVSLREYTSLNDKSCTQESDLKENENPERDLSFKSLINDQLSSLSSNPCGKKRRFNSPVSPFKIREKIASDISVELLQLLVKCADLVHEIKSRLGYELLYPTFA